MDYLFFELMAVMVLILILIANQRTIVKTLLSIKYSLLDCDSCEECEGCNNTVFLDSDNVFMTAVPDNFKLSTPWVVLRNKLDAFFESDGDISVGHCETEGNIVTIPIEIIDPKKYFALCKIMKTTYEYGNVTCKIKLSTTYNSMTYNSIEKKILKSSKEIISTALKGNSLFKDIQEVETVWGGQITFVVMAKEVLQFKADDLSDLYENENMVVEDAAYSIFDLPMCHYFSTAEE